MRIALGSIAVAIGVAAGTTVFVATGCSNAGACASCQDEKCGDLIALCSTDCQCVAECLGAEGLPGVPGCVESCGLTERPADFQPIEECVAVACPDSDECSTPDNYSVPASTPPVPTSDASIGGGDLADCGFDSSLSFDPNGAVLQLESADGNVCVRVERRNEGAGSLANTNWTLLDVRVGSLGAVTHLDDPSALCWYSSHHNFADWAHAWTGDRHHDLKLSLDGHGGRRTYELHTFEAGALKGACAPSAEGMRPVRAPVEMFPVAP